MSVPELMATAKQHWSKYLPRKVHALRAEGMLTAALNGAANLAQSEIDSLMQQGYQAHEAREVALSHHILLPAEKAQDGQDRELAAKEHEYQNNPPVTNLD